MKDYLRYMLYSTICIVTVVVALIFFEWFTSKPYTMESFATQAPYMILVGVTAGGEVYYADVDVPIQPKWARAATLTGIGDIAGSYGMLYSTTTAGSVPRFGAYDSTTWANMPSGTANKITVDDRGTVAGINGTRITVSPRNTTGFTQTGSSANSISISQGEGYCVGPDAKLYYSANPASSSWTLIDGGTTWKQVSLDSGVVCAIKIDGTLWCADSNIGAPTTGIVTSVGTGSSAVSLRSAANFTQQGGSSRLFDSICVKGGRLIGVGKDSKIYYSDSYKNPTWKDLSALSKVYILSTGLASTDPVPVFTKVIMIYPSATARKKRFIGSASACNANEQRIGVFCYQACPSGKAASGTQCPYLAKTIPAIATCPLDTSAGAGSGAQTQYANGSCYQKCPDGYQPSANGISCIGIPIQKSRKSLNTAITPSQQICGDGSLPVRYIRVRPSPLLKNNKLCIKSFSVELSANEGSGNPIRYTVTATDGSGKEAPITAGSPDKYLCGNTFDKDADGGKNNRASKLYWEVDIGSIRKIKKITITGCNYINENGEDTGVSEKAGADQITGMIIDLYTTNPTSGTPIATRTLGPSKTQTMTFNYVTQYPEMQNRCYDICPSINGVPSARLNDYTCMAASGGVTKRAISSPILLGPASCTQAIAGDGIPRVYSATTNSGAAVNIQTFVPDPTNNQYILSCDGLPGSVLKPLSTSVSWPAITTTSLSENFAPDQTVYSYYRSSVGTNRTRPLNFRTRMTNWLLDKQWKYLPRTDTTPTTKNVTWENASGTAYTNTDTPYLCVIEPTASTTPAATTTYTIGGAANVEYIYNSVYNSYIINTAKTYSNIVSITTLNSYLSDVCNEYEFRNTTTKRVYKYCPIPVVPSSTEIYEDIWISSQICATTPCGSPPP